MDNEKNKYADLLSELYKNEKLHIGWSKGGFALKIDDGVVFSDINRKEFFNYSFSILKIVRKILLEKDVKENDVKENDEVDSSVAKIIAEGESCNIEKIYLKNKSLLDTYDGLDYEVVSHYDKANAVTIDSAILKISYENDESQQHINMEISKQEVVELINKLNSLLEDLNTTR